MCNPVFLRPSRLTRWPRTHDVQNRVGSLPFTYSILVTSRVSHYSGGPDLSVGPYRVHIDLSLPLSTLEQSTLSIFSVWDITQPSESKSSKTFSSRSYHGSLRAIVSLIEIPCLCGFGTCNLINYILLFRSVVFEFQILNSTVSINSLNYMKQLNNNKSLTIITDSKRVK